MEEVEVLSKDEVSKIFKEIFESGGEKPYVDFCYSITNQEDSLIYPQGMREVWNDLAQKMKWARANGLSASDIEMMIESFCDIVYDDEDRLFMFFDLVRAWIDNGLVMSRS